MSSTYNIIIAGVGGQGTILASQLIAHASRSAGCFVRSAETIGMAQRGGSVVGHVRIAQSAAELHSPLVPLGEAQLLIGFEPGELVRALPYANNNSTVVCSEDIVTPVAAAVTALNYTGDAECSYLRRLHAHDKLRMARFISAEALAVQVGSIKSLNVALLGLVCELGLLSVVHAEQALELLIKPQYLDMNRAAFNYGRQCAHAHQEH